MSLINTLSSDKYMCDGNFNHVLLQYILMTDIFSFSSEIDFRFTD